MQFFFIYYFSKINYIHTFFFSLGFFLHHTPIPLPSLSTLLFLFLVHSGSHFHFLHLSLSLSLSLSLFYLFFIFYFLLFLFLLDSRTHSTVIRNREIKNKWLLAPPLIEGQRQVLSHFCSTVGCLLAPPWVRWLLSLLFFFFAFIVMIWLILRLCFWVCILIMLEFREFKRNDCCVCSHCECLIETEFRDVWEKRSRIVLLLPLWLLSEN